MLCYSCGKQKNELQPQKSAILNGISLLLCLSCTEEKYEPRWCIVLAGRQNGPEYVREYIVKRRYLGNTITAEELIA
jgi:hypothetical protein